MIDLLHDELVGELRRGVRPEHIPVESWPRTTSGESLSIRAFNRFSRRRSFICIRDCMVSSHARSSFCRRYQGFMEVFLHNDGTM